MSNVSWVGSKFREKMWPNPDSKFGFIERNRPNRFKIPRKQQAEPWFSRFGVRKKTRVRVKVRMLGLGF